MLGDDSEDESPPSAGSVGLSAGISAGIGRRTTSGDVFTNLEVVDDFSRPVISSSAVGGFVCSGSALVDSRGTPEP